MQPSAAASVPPSGDMDLQAMQSMDWLFKKERIYLLAQFWQQRATLAEKEVTTLKEQISNNTTNNCESVDGNSMDRQGFENELATKEKEITHLLEEVQRHQLTITKLQESSMAQIARLEDQLEQKRQQIARLEGKLDSQRDYEDLKRELSILRPELVNDIEAKIADAADKVPEQPKSPSTDNEEGPEKATTPVAADSTEKSAAPSPQPAENAAQPSPCEPFVNGNPKSPEDNNNHHMSNNNIPLATMYAVNNFLRADDAVKRSPYGGYDDHRAPFRFAEDLGMTPGSMVGRLGESLIPKGDPMEAKLQEMLRYNMDKYASHNLDTLNISKRVRELLSIHNIGQRLFAKYILGLSQGTVSELLSKPKPWDKLTEKGRDSYRKMHAWACDDNAVMLLKSLIPKKDTFSSGKESGLPGYGRADGPNAPDLSDERLAHILNEASQYQHHSIKNEDSRSNDDSKSPHAQCASPFLRDQNRKLKKYENDDIPQEKVVRIYQEELVKLMGRRMEDLRSREPFPSVFFPQFFSGGNPMDRTQEEIRMALDAYHREIAKLNQPGAAQMPLGLLALQQQSLAHANGGAGAQDLSVKKEPKLMNGVDEKEIKEEIDRHSGSAFSLVRPKIEPGVQSNSTASSPLGNAILPPFAPKDEFASSAAAASPLQRMASITNSLISQPPTQPHHGSSPRPLKAVLPPITQQQFDVYNNLNTEDIVKKVKEQLSQYSISQRLFGESVLGLSQGSVSDLLARPKPWHMLTQKGREPFIRMKMFLEDDNAVHKLVASQYKIAPEKLMRTGGYGGACAPISKPMAPTTKMISEAAGLLNKMQETQNLLPQLRPPQGHTPQPPPPPMLLTPPGLNAHHLSLPTPDLLKKSTPSPHGLAPTSMPHQASLRNMHQHMSPSVYEMAALTQDLDTQVITTKIKEALLANNIGQKIFGEAVLGLSQGSVSELLSKPKPWHMLSIKGREPFIRMQLWLNDAHNVDRLQALKNERREANKRRRSSGAGAHDNSSDTSSNDTSEFYHSNSPGPGPPSSKKQRVLFSEEQKEALKIAFTLDPYPNVQTIEFLATELGLSSRTITNWFHNHRMRLKQQVPHGLNPDVPPRDQSGGQPPFDPIQFRLLLNQRLLQISKERMGLSGVPLPYPPYLAANTNLAALIGRGLDLSALNNAVKEQMNGLDLSMGSLKRDYDDDEFEESNAGSEEEDSNLSDGPSRDEPGRKAEAKEAPKSSGGRSRRKPAAPQWVNPEWQDDKEKAPTGEEVIINGVCVMQTEDFRRAGEETVHIEPTPVSDRYDSDASSVRSNNERPEQAEDVPDKEADEPSKEENEEERWSY